MKKRLHFLNLAGWILGLIIFIIGALNLILVHPVPGIIFLLLSLIFFPPMNAFFRKSFHFSIPLAVKIILFVLIVWFTLGVSDLGNIIERL